MNNRILSIKSHGQSYTNEKAGVVLFQTLIAETNGNLFFQVCVLSQIIPKI